MHLFTHRVLYVIACVTALAAPPAYVAAQAAEREAGACALLTFEDITGIQGEAVQAAKSSSLPNKQFAMAQCFYTLASPSKSVSLTVAVPSAERPAAPRDFWIARFHLERERSRKARAAAGREPHDDAEAVAGVGDEAFWVGDARVGSLYVLAGGRFFRISVGGANGPEQRRERSLRLARVVLKRLAAVTL